MTVYRIVVAYDGTAYHGWQRQPTSITVVGMMEKSFKDVFHREISISGASRTDAGVHAFWQVATFSLPIEIAPEKLKFAWNNALPNDILVQDVKIVHKDFNPHYAVKTKTYHYNFFTERPLPTVQRYGWYFKRPIDFDLLKESLQVFVGKHDFRSFCTGYDMNDTIRTIDSIDLEYDQQMKSHRIVVKGPGFLRYMIRRIVGACLTVASKDDLTCDHLKIALSQKNPEQTLPNSPGKGLILYKIEYYSD